MKLYHFTADWCNPCKKLAPILEEFLGENPNIDYIKIDVDDQGYIDPDGVDCLEKCFKKKKNTYLVTLQAENAETHVVLTRSHLYQSLKQENRVFVSLESFKNSAA